MRASATCLAAALIGGSLAPGGEGLVFRAQARTRGGATAGRQRRSFCSGVEGPAVGKSVGALGRGGEMLMSAAAAGEQEAAAAGKLPWLDSTVPRELPDEISAENPLRVVIAGGGVGGLLTAKYLKMQGYDVSLCRVFFLAQQLHEFVSCVFSSSTTTCLARGVVGGEA